MLTYYKCYHFLLSGNLAVSRERSDVWSVLSTLLGDAQKNSDKNSDHMQWWLLSNLMREGQPSFNWLTKCLKGPFVKHQCLGNNINTTQWNVKELAFHFLHSQIHIKKSFQFNDMQLWCHFFFFSHIIIVDKTVSSDLHWYSLKNGLFC